MDEQGKVEVTGFGAAAVLLSLGSRPFAIVVLVSDASKTDLAKVRPWNIPVVETGTDWRSILRETEGS
jgi:hypothetical protein